MLDCGRQVSQSPLGGLYENQSSRARFQRTADDRAHSRKSDIRAQRARTKRRHTVLPERQFLDDGYSGATLVRPARDRLRDLATVVKRTKCRERVVNLRPSFGAASVGRV